ncbi:hypothetical protein CcaverHIS641_0108580 [Cutaneotrichosporon cavernicola]|nr:hypothetical protein CcaverHIS641_0108580 [Cutaneotrichosporon cavernicola]
MDEWDRVIRTASKWLADHAPVCRGFSGVEPWARGDSPVTLLVARRPKMPEAGPPMKGDKQTRSAFGCDACKKRKIKCDQARPVCNNCCASSRKRARRCVYAYDIIVRPTGNEDPTVESLQDDSTPGASPGSMSIETSDPVRPPTTLVPRAQAAPPDPILYPDPSDPAQLRPQTVDAEALSTLVDTHGLTWFMNAAEIVEKQVLASNQRRAFTEYRHAVLERCWNAYINYNGKLPLELPSTPVDTHTPGQFASAVNSMLALPGLDSLSSPSAEAITPEQLADLTQAALLHAFVSVGATHYAYWAGKRGEASEDHMRGGAALIQLSTNALLQVLRLQEAQAARHEEWEEEIDAKLLLAFSLAVTYRVCAVDPLGPATLRLECEWIARRGGPGAMISDAVLTPAQMELIPAVLNDAIYALQRGEPSFLPPDAAWLDTIPVAHRLIPEGYGISLEMAKFLLETVAVLYGPCADRADRLTALHNTLSNALVDIYASAHPARVQAGDMLYRQALICLVCLDGLDVPPDDPQLVSASDAILELFAEVVYGDIYTVRWALPLLVGGGLARKLSEEERERGERDRRDEAGRIFDAMADTCGLADIEAARALTEQVWERRDKGLPWRWRDTMRAMGVELFFV